MARHIAIRFDWHDVAGLPILDIFGSNGRTLRDGSLSWEAIAIRLGEQAVVLTVEPDTDQIFADHQPFRPDAEWESIAALGSARGLELGWCWVGTNSQGYKDSFTLAFGGPGEALEPRCMFLAEGSELRCFDLAPVRAG